MEEKTIYDRIKELLNNTDYPVEVKNINDIEKFLRNEDNTKLEEYEIIEQLYTMLLDDVEL